jgi:hypothetical protein
VPLTTSAFALPDRLSAKADPALIAGDDRHFAAIAESLQRSVAELSERLAAVRMQPGGSGQGAMERDLEIHRLTARLRALRRFSLDLCLGRIVDAETREPVYIGRLGLTDREGRQLLVDWRAPAAEPFFGATHADPRGLASRRRYRWTAGRVSDYWDEVFTADRLEGHAALHDESAFLASLGTSRSARMRDVLGTIQADQDAILRAGSRGALVVDGGPGTGKTVVALHRAAYLLYSEPHLARGGGVLVVGPHQPYLAYVAYVLPSLGEEGVQLCTVRDLVPEGPTATAESDPGVAALKSSAALAAAVDRAVKMYETPPSEPLPVETPWGDLWLSGADWAEAFQAAGSDLTHNEARDGVWEALLGILIDQLDDGEAPPHLVRRYLLQSDALTGAFSKAWPLLDSVGVVADLWSVPDYLRLCAPWLTGDEVQTLQRPDARAWTTADLPFLDAARMRIGDPGEYRRRRERKAALAAEREMRERVADDLIAADDSEMSIMSMLRGQDFDTTLVDEAPLADPDALAGPFAHIVIDEAQELTDAEWQMLLRRCPSRSFTIVGDRAQARHGFPESWEQRLERIELSRVQVAALTINYRTPAEVMAEAEPVIRAVEQLQGGEVVLDRIRRIQVEERHQDVGQHVARDQDAAFLDQQSGMAWGVGAMLEDPDGWAIPGDLCRPFGQTGDETEQLHRDVLGMLRWQPLGDERLPVGVRQQRFESGRASGGAIAGRIAEVGVPQHVVPVGMRREPCDDRLPQLVEVLREGNELVARDAWVDEQHAVRALDDNAAALEELALVNENTVSDVFQHEPSSVGRVLPSSDGIALRAGSASDQQNGDVRGSGGAGRTGGAGSRGGGIPAGEGRPSARLLELLRQHQDDAARAAKVGELVHVFIRRHAAKRPVSMPCGDLEGFVDVVDRERDAVHADLVRTSGLRLNRFGVDVLEELNPTGTVRRLEHRDVGMIAVEADGSVRPLTADGVPADERETEVGEERDRCLEVLNGDADVLEFDGHARHATEPPRSVDRGESGRTWQAAGLTFSSGSARHDLT